MPVTHDLAKTDFGRLTHALWTGMFSCTAEIRANQITAMMLERFGAVLILDATQGLIRIVSEHDLLASLVAGIPERHYDHAESVLREAGHRSRDIGPCVACQQCNSCTCNRSR